MQVPNNIHYLTTPAIVFDSLPKLFCFVCKTENKFTQTLSGLLNFAVILSIALIALLLLRLAIDICKYYIYAQYINNGIVACKAKFINHWVVITGGSDGIGLEFAKRFARHKFKLIIIARNAEKLEKTKLELEARGSPSVVTIQADFSIQDDEMYKRVLEELSLETRTIGMLINNVGTTTSLRFFHTVSFETMKRVVNVNSLAATFMLRAIIGQMHENKRGVIVNISTSALSWSPPFMGVYLPSKQYLNKLAQCMSLEYPDLTFVSLQTGIARTKLLGSEMSRPPVSLHVLPVDVYVRSAFNIIAYASTTPGLVTTCGHLFHQLPHWLTFVCGIIGLSSFNDWIANVRQNRKYKISKTATTTTTTTTSISSNGNTGGKLLPQTNNSVDTNNNNNTKRD